MHVNYGPHCTLDHPWEEGSHTLRSSSRFLPSCPLGGLGLWVRRCHNIRPVKPFETVPVIKGYTNKIK